MMKKTIAALFTITIGLLGGGAWAGHGGSGTHTRIVTYKSDSRKPCIKAIHAAGGKVVRELSLIDGLLVEFSGLSTQSKTGLELDPAVEHVEINEYRKWIETASFQATPLPSAGELLSQAEASAATVPGAPAEAKEEPKKRSELPWGVKRVGAPKVWSRTQGQGVRVAVIDTGIDSKHPDIAPNYAGGFNAIEPGTAPIDENGHGTHVAGTIAGAFNGKGVIGVAPKARLYAVKVLDGEGGGEIADIVEGLSWAVKNKMHIVNMSLGGPHSPAMQKAVERAYQAGIVIVAAAGNDPKADVSAPARYPETIAVSASTEQDGLAVFSTIGPEVDFIAPGYKILSAWPDGKFAELSGTSMASPHVAGLAALAVSFGASGTEAVRAFLRRGAVPVEGLGRDEQGAGLVDAGNWIQKRRLIVILPFAAGAGTGR